MKSCVYRLVRGKWGKTRKNTGGRGAKTEDENMVLEGEERQDTRHFKIKLLFFPVEP
jgi:hypothetical protein